MWRDTLGLAVFSESKGGPMVTIENVSGRMKTYTLTGQHLASNSKNPHGYKTVRRVTVHQAKSGHSVARVTEQPMADSVRLTAGEVREFDEAVAHCPAIKAAVARGELRVHDPKKKPTAPAPEHEPPTEDEPSTEDEPPSEDEPLSEDEPPAAETRSAGGDRK